MMHWSHILYIVSQLKNVKYDTEETENKLTQSDQAIIILGTNNIKRGDDGREIAEKLIEMAKKITRRTATQTKVCEIPPNTSRQDKDREVERCNYILRNQGKHTIRLTRLTTTLKRDDMASDGFHITLQGAEKIAKDIREHLMPNAVAGYTTKQILHMNPIYVGRLIGTGGRRKANLEEEYNVHIVASDTKIIIKGEHKAVEQAAEVVEQFHQEQKSQRRNRSQSRERSPSPQYRSRDTQRH